VNGESGAAKVSRDPAAGRRPETAARLLAFFWPAAYLSPFLLPGGLQSGNDFVGLYWKYKVYLLDALAFEHRIPGWSPSEACGYPFLANPFAAALYPLNLPLAVFYRLAGGYSIFDHQIFTVLGLCIFSLGLYLWLRESGAGVRAALVAALVLATSMKMTELQRFPNAMHAAAWFPWLLLGIALSRKRSTRVRGAATIASSTVLLLTSGYPYFAYYAQFLLLPYTLAVLWSRTRPYVIARDDEPARSGEAFATAASIAASVATPTLLCWPYLSAMRGLLSLTTDRAGADLGYATAHSSGAIDAVGGLLFPPAASAEGWFYFGQLPVLLLVLFVAGALDPRRVERRDRFLALGATVFALAVTSVTWGPRSPAFRVLWHCWPGFTALRVWPRLNVILVPVFALLLARAWEAAENSLASIAQWRPPERRRLWLTLTAAVTALLGVHGAFLLTGFTHRYWQKLMGPSGTQRAWPFPPVGFTLFALLASALLILTLSRASAASRRKNLVAAVFVAFAALDTGAVGLSQWAHRRGPQERVRFQVLAGAARKSLDVPRTLEYGTIQLDERYNAGVIANWYFRNYVGFLRSSAGIAPGEKLELERVRTAPGLATVLGLADARRIFLSPRLDVESPSVFAEETRAYEKKADAGIVVRKYDGDTMALDVTTRLPGVLCVIDNVAPGWGATVNGRSVPIEALFGTYKAVRIEAGASRVLFTYRPFEK
jgi:hypothetical protein